MYTKADDIRNVRIAIVLTKEQFGDPPSELQKAKLRNLLREAGVWIADIDIGHKALMPYINIGRNLFG